MEFLRVLGRLRGGFSGLMGRSWKPLGALLEALGAEKTKLESLLAALGSLPRHISTKKGSKMGPPTCSRTLLFEVPSWGPKLDPHFMVPQRDFKAFQVHVERLSESTFGCRNETQVDRK